MEFCSFLGLAFGVIPGRLFGEALNILKNYLSIMATRRNANIQISATDPNSNINLSIALFTISENFIEGVFVVGIFCSTPLKIIAEIYV